jgi:diaminopimelate epimerase
MTATSAARPTSQANLALTKHHGLGNDFLVLIEAAHLSHQEAVELAKASCNRHRGIGADGLLVVLPAPSDESADISMRLYNADGSVAEMSGNGIRCFAQAITMANVVPLGMVRVHTDAGLRTVEVGATDPSTGVANISVDMGGVSYEAHPVFGGSGTTVDVGNPHLVIPVDSLDEIDITVVGPDREAPYLDGPTHGINVEVIRAVDSATIDMVVWERGVGVTQACGTGATASAAVAHRLGLVGSRVTVRQPGGNAIVEISEGRATLIGPSQHIADINFAWDSQRNGFNS